MTLAPLLATILWMAAVDEPPAAAPADPKPEVEAKEGLESKRPALRLRRSKGRKADSSDAKSGSADDVKKDAEHEEPLGLEEKPVDSKETEKAPEVPDRNIPAPDGEKGEPSDLDRELIGELGQNLEGAQEEEDPLLRAGRRMREAEENLAKLEAGDPTIELQNKILADLDELLKQRQSGKPPPKNQNKNQDKNQKKQQKDQQQLAKQQQQKQKASQQGNENQSNEPQDRAGPARTGREEFGAPKEVKDVWGHLSELMRSEMSQYAKEGFLEKYREMLEQYYSTIATGSRSGTE